MLQNMQDPDLTAPLRLTVLLELAEAIGSATIVATTVQLRKDADLMSPMNNAFRVELLTLDARFETAQVTDAVRVARILARGASTVCILRTHVRTRLASVGNNGGGHVWGKRFAPKCKTEGFT